MRRAAIGLALALGLGSLAACVTVNERIVFQPRAIDEKASSVGDMALDHQAYLEAREPRGSDQRLMGALPAVLTHDLLQMNGETIAVTRVRPSNLAPDSPVILACMGNASDRVQNGVSYAHKLLPFGEVILFDYPGYGDSTGSVTAEGLLGIGDDLVAYVDALAGSRPIIYWGHSLGGFVCPQFAEGAGRVDGLVLETTAPNLEAVIDAKTPWYLFFVNARVTGGLAAYDTPDALEAFDGPILVVGGGRDDVLPVELSRSLAQRLEARGRDVQYLEYAQATHYDAVMGASFAADAKPFFDKVTGD